MSGWIKLHRKVLENEIWRDVTAFRLFTLLLLKASHKDGIKTNGITINRGQYLRSYSKLAEDLEYSEGRGFKKVPKSTIERKVKKLIECGMVSVSETVSGTLFTITKYEEYQGFDDHSGTVNGTDDETNVGRTRDERGTNVGQEQELKNLRIKELSTTTTTPADPFVEVHRAFESSICRLSAFQVESLEHWFNDFGQDKDILLEAIRIADDKNKRHYAFVEYLLKEWSNNRLTTVEQIRSHERNKFSNVRPFEPKKKVDSEYNYGF